MCTTRRYLFLCSHPATHRFRNEICDLPGVRGCRVRDYNVRLRHPCSKCRNRGMASVYTGEQEPEYDDTWHIPSRCFVNVGFQKLDPFRVDSIEPSTATATSPRPSIDEDPLALPLTPTRTKNAKQNICRRLLRRFSPRKTSPCCVGEAQNGAIEATRIEGREYRVNGVIPARCESPV